MPVFPAPLLPMPAVSDPSQVVTFQVHHVMMASSAAQPTACAIVFVLQLQGGKPLLQAAFETTFAGDSSELAHFLVALP